jgi:hypothetical protein
MERNLAALSEVLQVGPLFLAFLMIASAGWIARGRNVADRSRSLDQQTLVVMQLRNLTPLALMLLIFYSHVLALSHQSALVQISNITISTTAMLWLLLHLGGTVYRYCQGKPSEQDYGKGFVAEARLKNLRAARRRFGWCLTLYYFAGLMTVADVFSDIFLFSVSQSRFAKANQLHAGLVFSRRIAKTENPPQSRRSLLERPASKDYAISNEPAIISQLAELLPQLKGAVAIDLATPRGTDPADTRKAVAEIVAATGPTQARAAQITELNIRPDSGCVLSDSNGTCISPVMIWTAAPQFINDSMSNWDALIMSAMTLISVGLTDNPPVSLTMKFTVVFEELIGALFFLHPRILPLRGTP